MMASLHWQLAIDTPIMHYINFLMSHGFRPYSDIQDNNLPGSYMTEWVGMHLFGSGDLAWRIFEWAELAITTAAMVVIARPYDWAAGLFAGMFFLIEHTAEGPLFSGEREISLSAFILVGYAALFTATRLRQPGLMLAVGFCTAFAASIKPTMAPLAPLLLTLTVIILRRKGLRWRAYGMYALAGMLAALLLNLGFLALHGAVHNFLSVQREITAYYAGLQAQTIYQMCRNFFELRTFDVLLAGALLLLVARRRSSEPWTWEQWALLLGGLVGVLSYMVQRKNFLHHRYLYQEIAFLLIGIELMAALRRVGWARWVAASMAVYVVLYAVPLAARQTISHKASSDLTEGLQADLLTFQAIAPMDHQVICLDQVFGCLNALEHLSLVENVGLSGDMLIFAKGHGPAIDHAREWYWRQQQHAPASVLVLTNENFLQASDYERPENWPQYKKVMRQEYRLLTERNFPCERGRRDSNAQFGYRIYARLGTPFTQVQLPPQSVPNCPA